jgi:hypothetical protein
MSRVGQNFIYMPRLIEILKQSCQKNTLHTPYIYVLKWLKQTFVLWQLQGLAMFEGCTVD